MGTVESMSNKFTFVTDVKKEVLLGLLSFYFWSIVKLFENPSSQKFPFSKADFMILSFGNLFRRPKWTTDELNLIALQFGMCYSEKSLFVMTSANISFVQKLHVVLIPSYRESHQTQCSKYLCSILYEQSVAVLVSVRSD